MLSDYASAGKPSKRQQNGDRYMQPPPTPAHGMGMHTSDWRTKETGDLRQETNYETRSRGGDALDDFFGGKTEEGNSWMSIDIVKRYAYWILLGVLFLVVLLFVVLFLVAFLDYEGAVTVPDAIALQLNIERAIYFGLRADTFCALSLIQQCIVDGDDPAACGTTPLELQ